MLDIYRAGVQFIGRKRVRHDSHSRSGSMPN
jgi:hypothetical protein